MLGHIAHWRVSGTTLSPLEPSEAMWTLELGYVNAGFLLFCGLLLTTLILGRLFCGWACHVVAYQDLCAWLLARVGMRPRPVRSRLLVWVPLAIAVYMFAWPTLRRWWLGDPAPAWSLRLTTAAFWETFPGPGMALLTLLVDGALLVYWLGAKGFCTYGCPYGALFGLADKVAVGRIRVSDACAGCGQCTAVCTSNVRVHEEVARFGMVVDPGCMKCLDCVSSCPKEALSFGFGRPSLFAAGRGRRPARGDFTWPEEMALAVGFALGLLALRSLYGVVPLLLAVGLGVLTAVGVVVGWRLLTGADLRVQSWSLKHDGRWTPAGRVAAFALAAWFAFVAHSGWVQVQLHRGIADATAAMAPQRPAAEREALLRQSLVAFDHVAAVGLATDPRVDQHAGLVLRELGAFDRAEERLRRALAARPDWPAAVVPLSDLLVMRRAVDEAEAMLRALLQHHPDVVAAQQRLELLERGRERLQEPR